MPYRPALPADLPALFPLMEAFYREDGHPWEPEAARAALAALLRDPACGRAFLAEDGGAVVAYLVVCFGYSLEFHGRDAFLDELFVAPSARGRGLGREGLRVAESCCREAGVRALHLEVGSENETARQLYSREGFALRRHTLMSKRI